MNAVLTLPLVFAAALAAPQEVDPKPAAQPQQPTIQAVGADAARRPGRSIESIKEYRQGNDGSPYVRRVEDIRTIDLSKVDFDADVLATVNGKPVTRNQFNLWYALNAGQNGILRAQLEILTNKGVERILGEGGNAAAFVVPDEEVEAKLRAEEDMARAQGEEALVQYKERIENTLGWDRYRRYVKSHLQSERLLLPPIKAVEEGQEPAETDPSGLPVEAAELLGDQPELRDYLNQSYLSGQDFPAMFRTQFLKMLQQKMIDRAEIKYALEYDLPDGVYMTVQGEPITVDEVLEFVPESEDVRRGALRLCLLYRALDDALASSDVVLSNEEFEALFDAHKKEYEGTLFPLPNLIGLRGFFNMSEYREYYRRRCAYEKMMKDVVSDDDLRQHQEVHGRLFYESGKVNCEVFWVSLTDTEKKFELTGQAAWDKAFERLQAAQTALASGKEADAVREEFCSPDKGFPNGVTTHRMRNELRQAFSENDYIIFMTGHSLADDVFYNRVEGEIVGPVKMDSAILPGMRDSLGYMFVRVLDFQKTQALKEFDVQRPLIVSDFFDQRFCYFAHESLKNADIELTTAQ